MAAMPAEMESCRNPAVSEKTSTRGATVPAAVVVGDVVLGMVVGVEDVVVHGIGSGRRGCDFDRPGAGHQQDQGGNESRVRDSILGHRKPPDSELLDAVADRDHPVLQDTCVDPAQPEFFGRSHVDESECSGAEP